MKYKAIIFDLDGTLLDTLGDLARSINMVLEARGYPTHSLAAYRNFIGNGAPKLIQRSLPEGAGPELCSQCLEEFNEKYRTGLKDLTRPYPGIMDLLAKMARADLGLAILSNKAHDFSNTVVAHFFPKTGFKMVRGAQDHIPRKPDPQAALAMAAEFGLDSAEMVFLGDSAVDMQTAVNAGMHPVGASWGFCPREELVDHGAAKVIDHPSELLAEVYKP